MGNTNMSMIHKCLLGIVASGFLAQSALASKPIQHDAECDQDQEDAQAGAVGADLLDAAGHIDQRVDVATTCPQRLESERVDRKPVEQVEKLFKHLPDIIKPGMREIDLSAEAENFLRRNGHAGTIRVRMSPDPMGMLTVASGDSALYPTGFDGHRLCGVVCNAPAVL